MQEMCIGRLYSSSGHRQQEYSSTKKREFIHLEDGTKQTNGARRICIHMNCNTERHVTTVDDEQTEKKAAILWPSLQLLDCHFVAVTCSGSTNHQKSKLNQVSSAGETTITNVFTSNHQYTRAQMAVKIVQASRYHRRRCLVAQRTGRYSLDYDCVQLLW